MTGIICNRVNRPRWWRIRRTASPFLVAAMLSVCLAAPAPAQESAARAVVDAFHATLLEVMKNAEKLGMDGRIRRLGPRVAESFHLRLMVAVASGRHWRNADDGQRRALHKAFERFSIATYADRFSSYSGESFEITSVKTGPRKTILVNTRINRRNDTPVAITYVLKRFAGVARIVDVVVDIGISELAVRRSEYAQTLKRGGVDALIAALDKKTNRLIER